MNMMDLLMIPGLDGSEKLERMRRESKRRMERAISLQALGVAMMNSRNESKKKKG